MRCAHLKVNSSLSRSMSTKGLLCWPLEGGIIAEHINGAPLFHHLLHQVTAPQWSHDVSSRFPSLHEPPITRLGMHGVA